MSSPSSSSQLFIASALALCSFMIGYRLGSNPTRITPKDKQPEPQAEPTPEYSESDEGESEDIADGDLTAIKAGILEPCKLVLVVRTDLGMTSGKIAAQCGHATLACYKALFKTNPQLVQHWERTGQAKIALKASSEDQILELEAIAKSLNVCARSVLDAGRTQIAAGSRTVLGIGPAPVQIVNQITGHLKLL